MDYAQLVRTATEEMEALGEDGRLHVDSFQIVDLIARLEKSCGVKIPSAALQKKWFQSVDSVVQLVTKYAAKMDA